MKRNDPVKPPTPKRKERKPQGRIVSRAPVFRSGGGYYSDRKSEREARRRRQQQEAERRQLTQRTRKV